MCAAQVHLLHNEYNSNKILILIHPSAWTIRRFARLKIKMEKKKKHLEVHHYAVVALSSYAHHK